MFKLNLMPRENKFFTLFEQSAENIMKAAKELKSLVDTWDNVPEKVAAITEIENQGDSITHQIMYQLNRTFVTPFDREDIALLAHSLDDVTDFIQSAADCMLIYKVDVPGHRAKELADIIVQISAEVCQAMPQLRQNGGKLQQVLGSCVEINRLENVADRIFRSALGELFEDAKDMSKVIKWREIYEHMETATDRCEDVANVLEGVALKQA